MGPDGEMKRRFFMMVMICYDNTVSYLRKS